MMMQVPTAQPSVTRVMASYDDASTHSPAISDRVMPRRATLMQVPTAQQSVTTAKVFCGGGGGSY